MANSIVIRGTEYPSVPHINVPNAEDTSEEVVFYDTSDATISSGDQMLDTATSYGASGKITGNIPTKTASNMTASGATVTAPAGFYATNASKSIASGSATTPATTISVTPTINVSSGGLITASVSASQSVTPSVNAGYISSGTAGTVSVSGSDTEQLTTKAAATITPTTSNQTIASGTYLTGAQTILGDSNLQSGNIVEGTSIFGVNGSAKLPSITQDVDGTLHIS